MHHLKHDDFGFVVFRSPFYTIILRTPGARSLTSNVNYLLYTVRLTSLEDGYRRLGYGMQNTSFCLASCRNTFRNTTIVIVVLIVAAVICRHGKIGFVGRTLTPIDSMSLDRPVIQY